MFETMKEMNVESETTNDDQNTNHSYKVLRFDKFVFFFQMNLKIFY